MLGSITSLTDFVHKLLGKAFLFAGWLPALLFTLAVLLLVERPADPREAFQTWLAGDTKQVVSEALAFAGATVLLGYLLFGMRGWTRGLLAGDWPGFPPFPWLRRCLVALQVRRRTRLEERAFWAHIDFDIARFLVDDNELVGLKDLLGKDRPLPDCTPSDWERAWRASRRFGRWRTSRIRRALRTLACLKSQTEAKTNAASRAEQALLKRKQDDAGFAAALRLVKLQAYQDWSAVQTQVDAMPSVSYAAPTPLGNILSRLADYPQRLYGINLIILWPRLAHVMSNEQKEDVDDSLTFVDFCCTASLLSLVAAGIAVWQLPFDELRQVSLRPLELEGLVSLWPVVLASGAALALYRLSLIGAEGYASKVKASIDLCRFELLKQLHLPLPPHPVAERVLWSQVNGLFGGSAEPSEALRFKHEGATDKPASPPPEAEPLAGATYDLKLQLFRLTAGLRAMLNWRR